MAASLIVEDSHFEYLKLQKGSLSHLASDRLAWDAAYQDSIREQYEEIKPFLPVRCGSILDVGSGLGGIDAVLNLHYGGGVQINLLDGEDDAPVMVLHRRTFNSMEVAADFLGKNGVKIFRALSPEAVLESQRAWGSFDLILSFGSWCFHYAPDVYLDFVRRCCRVGTVLILDVRKDNLWLSVLEKSFRFVATARDARKFVRAVFVADEHNISRGLQSLVA